MSKSEEKYFKWVLKQVYFDQLPHHRRYNKLMGQLFRTKFIYPMIDDEQRALDGLILRKEYGIDYGFFQECSVLEMLVEFALRIETEWIGNPRNFRPEIIFWTMIQNLGLDLCFDEDWEENDRNWRVIAIVDFWMERRYNPDGFGGIFPMKHTERDQRQLSLWDQMLEYITENNMC